MARINVNIPAAAEERVHDAFASAYGWEAEVPDPDNPGQTIPNPQSKADFTAERIVAFVKEVVAGQEAAAAAETAREQAAEKARNDVNVTRV